MIVYNTTYSVASDAAPDWIRWMQTFFLSAAMATNLPAGYRLLRLLTELDNGGITYSVQLDFTTQTDYESYQDQHADTMRQRVQHRFGNQYVSFETLLEDVE